MRKAIGAGLLGMLAITSGCDKSPIERQYDEQVANGSETRSNGVPIAGDPVVYEFSGTYEGLPVKIKELETKWGKPGERLKRYSIEAVDGNERLYAATIFGGTEFKIPEEMPALERHRFKTYNSQDLRQMYESVRHSDPRNR